MSQIFINYRRQDSEGYVGRLYDRLGDYFELGQVFMDVEGILPGVDFVSVLETAVAGCSVFLCVIGPQWLTASGDTGTRRLEDEQDFVRLEIELAIKHGKTVIPVLVGRAKMPGARDLPESIRALARRNAFELTQNRFADDVAKLAAIVRSSLLPAKPRIKSRADSETMRRKMKALKTVRDELSRATDSPLYRIRLDNNYLCVCGDGNPDANIVFIGQAPGEYEAMQGRAFVGASGDILDEMLLSIGLRRDDIYVTNVVMDRTPDNRDPILSEIVFYTPYLNRIIDIIQPGVIVTLGRFAMTYVLKKFDLQERKQRISQLHGKLLQAPTADGAIFILPLYHPAVVLYSPNERETLLSDFQQLRPFV